MQNKYTEEQIKDIEERTQKAADALNDLQLQPAVMMQAVNIGDDVFGLKPIAYLQDKKFTATLSPIQNETPKTD